MKRLLLLLLTGLGVSSAYAGQPSDYIVNLYNYRDVANGYVGLDASNNASVSGTLTGGTVTSLGSVNGTKVIIDNGAGYTPIWFENGGSARWEMGKSNNDDFYLQAKDTSGNNTFIPLSISRTSGIANFSKGVSLNGSTKVTGGLTTDSLTSTGSTSTGTLNVSDRAVISSLAVGGSGSFGGSIAGNSGSFTNGLSATQLQVGGMSVYTDSSGNYSSSGQGLVAMWSILGDGATDFINARGLGGGGFHFCNVSSNGNFDTSASCPVNFSTNGSVITTADMKTGTGRYLYTDGISPVSASTLPISAPVSVTGNLTVSDYLKSTSFLLDNGADYDTIYLENGGVPVITLGKDPSGNFFLSTYVNGTYNNTPITIDHTTGKVSLNNSVNVSGGLTTDTATVTAGANVKGGLTVDVLNTPGTTTADTMNVKHLQANGTLDVSGNLSFNGNVLFGGFTVTGATNTEGDALFGKSVHMNTNFSMLYTAYANLPVYTQNTNWGVVYMCSDCYSQLNTGNDAWATTQKRPGMLVIWNGFNWVDMMGYVPAHTGHDWVPPT